MATISSWGGSAWPIPIRCSTAATAGSTLSSPRPSRSSSRRRASPLRPSAVRRAVRSGAAGTAAVIELRQRWRLASGGNGLQPWPARDVRRGLRPMRQGHPGAVPANWRAPGLLQRLLPSDARLTSSQRPIGPRRGPLRSARGAASSLHGAERPSARMVRRSRLESSVRQNLTGRQLASPIRYERPGPVARARPTAARRLHPLQRGGRTPATRPRRCPPPTSWRCSWRSTCATTSTRRTNPNNDHLIF